MKKFQLLLLWLTLSLTGTTHAYRDKEHGTFLTRDPIGYGDGPNVYCYVHNNPINAFDPLGLKISIGVGNPTIEETKEPFYDKKGNQIGEKSSYTYTYEQSIDWNEKTQSWDNLDLLDGMSKEERATAEKQMEQSAKFRDTKSGSKSWSKFANDERTMYFTHDPDNAGQAQSKSNDNLVRFKNDNFTLYQFAHEIGHKTESFYGTIDSIHHQTDTRLDKSDRGEARAVRFGNIIDAQYQHRRGSRKTYAPVQYYQSPFGKPFDVHNPLPAQYVRGMWNAQPSQRFKGRTEYVRQ